MLAEARRRELAVVVVTKLDGLARSLHQLVTLGRELDALEVDIGYPPKTGVEVARASR